MYQFKLQTLLNHRQYEEEILQKELAESKKAFSTEQEKLRELKRERRNCLSEFQQKQQEIQKAFDMAMFFPYLKQLKEAIDTQISQVKMAEKIVEQKRKDLVGAMKKRKTLDKIKENNMKEYQKKVLQRETRAMDEVAVNRHHRLQ